MSLDFWCASNELKINLSKNGFSLKSGFFLCDIVTNMFKRI